MKTPVRPMTSWRVDVPRVAGDGREESAKVAQQFAPRRRLRPQTLQDWRDHVNTPKTCSVPIRVPRVPHSRSAGNLANAITQLTESQIADVLGKHEARNFGEGEIIVQQGDPSDAFYLITRGKVDVLNRGPSGEVIFLRSLVAGDYFGEIGLIQDVPRTATVQVSHGSEVEVIVVDRETFLDIYNQSGEAQEMIGRTMCERLLDAGT